MTYIFTSTSQCSVLRNCLIKGEIPEYIGEMAKLKVL